MATVTRGSLLLWLQDLLGLQSGADKVPTEISNTIQPIVDIVPHRTTIARHTTRTTTTTGLTLFATPTDKDFFLTYAHLSVTKDVSNDNTNTQIQVTIDGANRVINSITTQTLTVANGVSNESFAYPIKIDRGSDIKLVMVFAAGTMIGVPRIGGFILE